MIKERSSKSDTTQIFNTPKKRSFHTASNIAHLPPKRVTISQLKKIVQPVFKKNRILKAFLFGSYARGTEDSKSDIDIFIVKNTNKRFLDRFEEFTELYHLLNNYAIDLLIYSPEELERNNHRPFIKTILSEGVALYER